MSNEGLDMLVEGFNGQDKEKLADLFRDIIAEEIRSGCLKVVGAQLEWKEGIGTLSIDFMGLGDHEDDLLTPDRSRAVPAAQSFIPGVNRKKWIF